jgi:DNA polymerase III epsilon subunit-like protein
MGRMVDLQAAAWFAWEAGAIELPEGKDGLPKLNLDHIAAGLGLSRASATHNALEDCLLTLTCFCRLQRKIHPAPLTTPE